MGTNAKGIMIVLTILRKEAPASCAVSIRASGIDCNPEETISIAKGSEVQIVPIVIAFVVIVMVGKSIPK